MLTAYEKVNLPETNEIVGTGWMAPLPDFRDRTEDHPEIAPMVKTLGVSPAASLPTKTDLRRWCSPIENQGNLGSCTAHAGVGIAEYYENRAFGRHIDGSRLFVYKTTRNLMGVVGDTGAWMRTTMGALAICGVPPEKYWPYTTKKNPGPAGERTFDDEPSNFVYAIAENFEALSYFRHDPQGVPADRVLGNVKRFLAYGIPSMLGFYGFRSFNYTNVPGGIPYPCPGEHAIWGHAIVAVGYDDDMKIKNTKCNKETKGAFLIRNSWGTGWGDKGYGWLPYEYVLKRLALDFWSLLRMEWVNTRQFGL
ncbi:C1 family peptidase [Desulfonema magnum]|uniref:Peptidase family protein, C1A-like n=1 Tax=Desulfonema magnum TaxID=45655 RepID=A0A975GK20_9BACT|nr:C1 family peptidase [Desulfonema magnum]QTA84251.1 Peptidase family protein, C1A-like [Desulfonema magnum]